MPSSKRAARARPGRRRGLRTSHRTRLRPRSAKGPGAPKGQCNKSQNAQPMAQFNGDLTGSGVVSF
jgi:hypothetical protein